MTLEADLSISIDPPDYGPAWSVEREAVKDLHFADEIPGGFADGYLEIDADHFLELPSLRAFSDLMIHDGSTQCYVGRIERIRRIWRGGTLSRVGLEAYGWQRHASDDIYRGAFKDRRLERWRGRARGPKEDRLIQTDARLDDDATNGPEFVVAFPGADAAEVITGGAAFELFYDIPSTFPGGQIKRIYFKWKASVATSAISFRVYDPTGAADRYNVDHATSEQTVNLTTVTGRSVNLRPYLFNSDSTGPGGRNVEIWDLQLWGTPLDSDAGAGLLASNVVKEVIAQVCPKFNVDNVFGTSFEIDPLVYDEPVRPRQVFDEMQAFTPSAYNDPPAYWAVWEKLPSGLYAFELSGLGTDVHYECDLGDFEIAFDHAEQRNKVIGQFYKDDAVIAERSETQTIDELDALGLTLTDVVGPLRTSRNAQVQRVQQVMLSDSKAPARAGQIIVHGDDVRDARTGQPIPIQRLRSGKRIRLGRLTAKARSVTPHLDENVFVVRRVEKTPRRDEATLTLDNPTDRADELIARLRA